MAKTPPTHYVSFSAEISQQTTETLLGVMGDLANKGAKHVCLLLSTPGGSVMNGMTAYNMLRAMPFELTTHNVGNVDSIGNVIFLAGEHRYSNRHATFMFHGVGFDVLSKTRFEEKNLKERLEGLLADQKKIGAVIADRTTLSGDEINESFLQAVTRDPDYAKAHGIIDEIRDIRVPKGAPLMQLVFKR